MTQEKAKNLITSTDRSKWPTFGTNEMAFHLHAPGWYGWQMLPGYTGVRCIPWFSPIHVRRVNPLKTGQGFLELEFFHALYAAGVQDFKLTVKVLHHGENFLAARIIDGDKNERLAVISHIEFGWLERFCPELTRAMPPEYPDNEWYGSVSAYLDSVFFQSPPSPSQPEDPNSGCENEWLAACALRFDGYACAAAFGLDTEPYPFCQKLLGGQLLLESSEELMTAMFMLQRFLMKEGVESKEDSGWKLFRELFLTLASQSVSPRYKAYDYAKWEVDFVPVLPVGLALIRHLHRTTKYDLNCATSANDFQHFRFDQSD